MIAVRADAVALPFTDESVDVHDGLHYPTDPAIAVREMVRVGRMSCRACDKDSRKPRRRAGNDVQRLGAREVEGWLADGGIQTVKHRDLLLHAAILTRPEKTLSTR